MSEASSNKPAAAGKRRRRRLALSLMLIAGSILGVFTTRDADPAVSSAWPRPYDPAKPFNMLGVPGVSVEQRKRAEDLLVRSLQEAPRWSDYQAAVDAGWQYSVRPSTFFQEHFGFVENGQGESVGFDHIVNPLLLNDGRMLDPRYPESLVYKVANGERSFVAYLYIAEPDIPLEDPRISGFAGRLIEWHDHSDVCWQFDEEQLFSRITGLKSSDGSCPEPETGGAASGETYVPGEAGTDSLSAFLSTLMTHVWVVERRCGPFSGIEGALQGVSATPLEERVDLCEH